MSYSYTHDNSPSPAQFNGFTLSPNGQEWPARPMTTKREKRVPSHTTTAATEAKQPSPFGGDGAFDSPIDLINQKAPPTLASDFDGLNLVDYDSTTGTSRRRRPKHPPRIEVTKESGGGIFAKRVEDTSTPFLPDTPRQTSEPPPSTTTSPASPAAPTDYITVGYTNHERLWKKAREQTIAPTKLQNLTQQAGSMTIEPSTMYQYTINVEELNNNSIESKTSLKLVKDHVSRWLRTTIEAQSPQGSESKILIKISAGSFLSAAEIPMLDTAYRVDGLYINDDMIHGQYEWHVLRDHEKRDENDKPVRRLIAFERPVDVGHTRAELVLVENDSHCKVLKTTNQRLLQNFAEVQNGKDANRIFVVSFQREEIEFRQISELLALKQGKDRAKLGNTMNAIVSYHLESLLREHGAEKIVVHGHKVFGEIHTPERVAGVQMMRGLEGKIVIDDGMPGSKAQLEWKPCEATFFQDMLVSDFMLAHAGPEMAGGHAQKVAALAKTLKGVQVVVATATGIKQIRTIRTVDESVRLKPEALIGLPGMKTVDDLKYPDMPCVEVGTEARAWRFPAEFCKILPGQPFHGEGTLHSLSGAFDVRKPASMKTQTLRDPTQARDVFPTIKSDTFKIGFMFVKPKAMTADIGKVCWNLQYEMGERFGKKLDLAVFGRNHLPNSQYFDYDGNDQEFLASVTAFLDDANKKAKLIPSPLSVLVLTVPKKLPAMTINAARALCDKAGVQCNILSLAEVKKRFHPQIDTEMAKYAGAVVRKIFARALYPGETDQGSEIATTPTSQRFALSRFARVVGLHSISLRDIFGKTVSHNGKTIKLDNAYLITTVSVNASDPSKLHTTAYVKQVEDIIPGHQTLTEICATSLSSHIRSVDGESAQPAHSAVYQTGSDVEAVQLHTEAYLLAKAKGRGMQPLADVCNVALITMTLEQKVSLGTNTSPILPLPSTPAHIPAQTDMSPSSSAHDMLSHVAKLETKVLSPLFRRSPDAQVPSLWRTTYHQLDKQVNDSEPSTYSYDCLQQSPLPTISYLAQQASKRARLHLVKVDDSTTLSRTGVPFVCKLDEMHEQLKGSLYFL